MEGGVQGISGESIVKELSTVQAREPVKDSRAPRNHEGWGAIPAWPGGPAGVGKEFQEPRKKQCVSQGLPPAGQTQQEG